MLSNLLGRRCGYDTAPDGYEIVGVDVQTAGPKGYQYRGCVWIANVAGRIILVDVEKIVLL